MPLTNTQIKYYDSNVLRLPKEKRETYNAQVDRLIAALKDSLKKQDKITIKKVVKAGSFAKHTILRPNAQNPADVDVVFYISGQKVDEETFATLSQKSTTRWSTCTPISLLKTSKSSGRLRK